MKIAVTGATGQLGRLVIADLKRRLPASDIVALVRDPAKAADLGVEARRFDYDSSVDEMAGALGGIDRLLLISANEIGKRGPQHRRVIEAAAQAGISLLAYTSLLHADHSPMNLAEEHRDTESALAQSGVPHVILRNGWYGENYASGITAAAQYGTLIGSAGAGKISAAARKDYAEAAAVVLTTPDHAGKTYELGADQAWTLSDLAAEISAQTGKEIPYQDLSEGDYTAALVQAGLPEGLAAMIARWDRDASEGALFDGGKALSKLIGRPTTPLAEIVRAVL